MLIVSPCVLSHYSGFLFRGTLGVGVKEEERVGNKIFLVAFC